jgi:hypothetical protein
MVYTFKIDDEKKKQLAQSISEKNTQITRVSNEIQTKCNLLSQLIMVNDWYMSEGTTAISQHYEDADEKYLVFIDDFYLRYGMQLNEFNEILQNVISILKDNINYDDEDIKRTIDRVMKHL